MSNIDNTKYQECLRVLDDITIGGDHLIYIPSLAIFAYREYSDFYLILPTTNSREDGTSKVSFNYYRITPIKENDFDIAESTLTLDLETLKEHAEHFLTNDFYKRRYSKQEIVEPLLLLLEKLKQEDVLSLLNREASVNLFICQAKNTITAEIKPVLTFLKLRKDCNPTGFERDGKTEYIYTYDAEFTTTVPMGEHFTRTVEYPAKEVETLITGEDGNNNGGEAYKGKFIIMDNQVTGVMSFCLKENGCEWSSRESVISCISGYECARILIDNTVYHMHLKELIQYIPEGYVLAQLHSIYDDGKEKLYSITSVEDMKKFPDKIIPVTIDDQVTSFE